MALNSVNSLFLTDNDARLLDLGGGNHQHDAIDMTGGFHHFLFSSLCGKDSHFD